MIRFKNERVISFSIKYFDVYWEVSPTTEDLQEYEFYVERSESEEGPWQQIAGPLIDRYHVRDNNVPLRSHNRILFYRIKALHVLSGTELYSKVIDRAGKISLLAQEMIRREDVLFREFVGVQCWLFPRRTFGQRCPQCWDDVLQKRRQDQCPTCWGTGFSGGYHYPIGLWGQVDDAEQTEQVTMEDHRQVTYHTFRTGPSPAIKPMDLVVDHLNRRFRVFTVGGTTRLGVGVRQEVKMVIIERGAIEDSIPLKIDASSVRLVPEREFSNPHTPEASQSASMSTLFGAYGYK